MGDVKRCTRCGETKPLDAFPPHPKTRDGRKSHCRPCATEVVRESRQRHGYDRERARVIAEREAARWVRERYPNVWLDMLAAAEAKVGIHRDLHERAS